MNRTIMEKKKTSQEVWSGTLADYSDLKIFGCPAYAHVDNGKLEPRSIKEIKPPTRFAEADLVAYALNVAEDIDTTQKPYTYSKALSKGKNVIRCKWVFKKKKRTPRVEQLKYKARLVAKGYSQVPSVDFTDVFSPIVKHSLIRALLGIVAMYDLELEQLDVKITFLHGEIEEDIYMQRTEGFVVSEKEDYNKFWFNMKSAKHVSTPSAAHFKLSLTLSPQSDDEIDYMSHVSHSSAVGSLMYATVSSHPDLSYVVRAVSRYMANPDKEH
ncbi:Integrase, catalytic core [Gossypium australe]|uniref:Integrase, catalytic core n=1 Tax=Gossypium australe TaxID=47621 RepID=A0A5B6WUH5_9ROSI|nr:Integrase, catalytic core [Gossypium australe]